MIDNDIITPRTATGSSGTMKTVRLIPAILLVIASFIGCTDSPAEPPNIVLVVIDTLRADHCSAYGYFRKTTPRLEQLAAHGTLYSNAWSQAPWTTPSMVSLFTGRYVVADYRTIPPDAQTLPERLQAGGYRTGAVVANPVLCENTGFERGFEHFTVADKIRNKTQRMETTLPADKFTPLAVELITEKLEPPFFAWLHLFDPHFPHSAPARFSSVHQGTPPLATLEDYRSRQPAHAEKIIDQQAYNNIENTLRRYDMEVAFADEALGKIMVSLREKGLLENTVIIVTSDHGEGLYEHACYPEMAEDKLEHGLYVSHYSHVYEEALHVPLVLQGPGIAANQRIDGLVENLDLYPTMLHLAGLEADPGTHGMNLLAGDWKAKRAIYAFGPRDHAMRARNGYKLIHPVSVDKTSDRIIKPRLLTRKHTRDPQLYNLDSDLDERNDLGEQRPAEREAMQKTLFHWQEKHKDALSDTPPTTEKMLERLRALGYLK